MSAIKVDIKGAERLVYNMMRMPQESRARLKRAVQFFGLLLVQHIQSQKLSGQALHQRTGRLKASIHEETTDSDTHVRTDVGTNVEYARVHEYGFQGPSGVKGHMRTIKQAFGKPIAAKEIYVRPFFRGTNMPERSFMRSSLRELEPRIKDGIQKVALDIARQATSSK